MVRFAESATFIGECLAGKLRLVVVVQPYTASRHFEGDLAVANDDIHRTLQVGLPELFIFGKANVFACQWRGSVRVLG